MTIENSFQQFQATSLLVSLVNLPQSSEQQKIQNSFTVKVLFQINAYVNDSIFWGKKKKSLSLQTKAFISMDFKLYSLQNDQRKGWSMLSERLLAPQWGKIWWVFRHDPFQTSPSHWRRSVNQSLKFSYASFDLLRLSTSLVLKRENQTGQDHCSTHTSFRLLGEKKNSKSIHYRKRTATHLSSLANSKAICLSY